MMQDPPRLKELADTPAELGTALDALRQTPNDAARVARVAVRLGPWLDAPPPPYDVSALSRRVGPHTLKALRLFVTGMVVGASVLWLSRDQPPADKPAAVAVAPASSVVLDVPAVLPATQDLQASVEPLLQHDGSSARGASSHATHTAAGRLPHSARSRGGVSLRGGATSAPSTGSASSSTEHGASAQDSEQHGSAEPTPVEARESAREQPPDAAATPAADAPAAEQPSKAADVPKGEVELLFQARQLRRSAPRKALALLDEHAARFADGMLAPEREVIAIEILRALGETEQAAQRVARYRVRYPKSLHLPGLENKH